MTRKQLIQTLRAGARLWPQPSGRTTRYRLLDRKQRPLRVLSERQLQALLRDGVVVRDGHCYRYQKRTERPPQASEEPIDYLASHDNWQTTRWVQSYSRAQARATYQRLIEMEGVKGVRYVEVKVRKKKPGPLPKNFQKP